MSWENTRPLAMTKAQGERGGTPASPVTSAVPTPKAPAHGEGVPACPPTSLHTRHPTDTASAASQ